MSKLPTNEELKARWEREKIARKHEDAAEVMYEALHEIRRCLGAHAMVAEEDTTPSLENLERIASAALATADGIWPHCRAKL
jgi:hypothetical protein